MSVYGFSLQINSKKYEVLFSTIEKRKLFINSILKRLGKNYDGGWLIENGLTIFETPNINDIDYEDEDNLNQVDFTYIKAYFIGYAKAYEKFRK
jgi:hypothetical protein